MIGLLFIHFLIRSSCAQTQNFDIVSIKPYEQISVMPNDSNIRSKTKYFLIKNFSYTDQIKFPQIDSFAFRHLNTDYTSYAHYVIQFYSKSDELSENFENDESDRIETHGDDLIYNFLWKKGRFAGFEYFKEGKLIYYEYISQDGKVTKPGDLKLDVKQTK